MRTKKPYKLVGRKVVDVSGSEIGVIQQVFQDRLGNVTLANVTSEEGVKVIPLAKAVRAGKDVQVQFSTDTSRGIQIKPRRNKFTPRAVRAVYRHYDVPLPDEYRRGIPRTFKVTAGPPHGTAEDNGW